MPQLGRLDSGASGSGRARRLILVENTLKDLVGPKYIAIEDTTEGTEVAEPGVAYYNISCPVSVLETRTAANAALLASKNQPLGTVMSTTYVSTTTVHAIYTLYADAGRGSTNATSSSPIRKPRVNVLIRVGNENIVAMQNPAAFDDYEPYRDDQALSDSARSSRPPSSLSAHLNGPGLKPYRRLTPTPSQRNSPSLPFPPLAQPRRSTPSSELSGSNPYSPSPDSSEYSNPYSSSQLVPPTSSYDTAHRAIAGSHRRAGSQGQEDMSHMPVEDLLWIPSIIKMYNDYNHLKDQCLDLSSSISSSIKTQTKMYEESLLLRWQLDQARSGAAPPLNRNRPDSRPAALPDTQAAASTFGNSSQRPEEYPVSILWTFADAKKDRTVGTTLTNPNRPSLGQIVRHPDGSVIDESTYAMVHSSARNVAMTLLLPLVNKWQELKGKTGKNSPGTKSFFRTFFHNEWIDAILQLEELQPLLTYCAGHWKAEAVLQNMLDSLRTKEGNDHVDDIDDADDMYNADVEQGGQNQSKRPYMPSMDSTHRSPKRNKTTAAVDLTCISF
ncbi:hypothetical protein JOM56_013766 [Amanita muscaria]